MQNKKIKKLSDTLVRIKIKELVFIFLNALKLRVTCYALRVTNQKGSIVVLGLLISTGIIVISSELALYVASALRQARTIDSATLAYFNAESGVESVLYQIRKGQLISGKIDVGTGTPVNAQVPSQSSKILGDGKWSYFADEINQIIAGDKFLDKTDRLEKSFFSHDSTIQVPLYERLLSPAGADAGIKSLGEIRSIKISWDDAVCPNECDPAQPTDCIKQIPWIESTAVELATAGDSIQWRTNQQLTEQQVKKDFRSVTEDGHEIIIPLCKTNAVPQSGQIDSSPCSNNPFVAKPYFIRIKPYFCDLRKAVITIHSDDAATSDPKKIPEYYMINPQGSYGGITSSVRAFVPKDENMSGLFDFSLFSEEKLCKSDKKDKPNECDEI